MASTAARGLGPIRPRSWAWRAVWVSRASTPFFQQALGGLLEGGVVGDLGQAQRVAQLGPLAEDLLQAAVVDLEELAQCQQGEMLMLGEVAPGVF